MFAFSEEFLLEMMLKRFSVELASIYGHSWPSSVVDTNT